jgi:hypothetical protein
MTYDHERMLESKRVQRERMAALPIGDKLRVLDALRERSVAIRRTKLSSCPPEAVLREEPVLYRITPE